MCGYDNLNLLQYIIHNYQNIIQLSFLNVRNPSYNLILIEKNLILMYLNSINYYFNSIS